MKVIKLTCTATLMLVASIAYAGPREDWQLLADSIEVSGNVNAAESIRQAVGALSDEDLESVYGGADLVDLASKFSANNEVTQRAVGRFPELGPLYKSPLQAGSKITINGREGDKNQSSLQTPGLPDGEGYPTPGWCPFSPNRSDADALLIAQDVVAAGRVALEAAEALWSGLSRGCDEVIVILGEGGNLSLACIPVDIVLFAAELVVGAAETVVEHIAFCDSAVDSTEIEGSFERIRHVHEDLELHETALATHHTNMSAQLSTHDADISNQLEVHDTDISNQLETHDTDISNQLATHDEDIKALLGTLQETVDENQRLIKISMGRQLEIMRLLITPNGRRVVNGEVLSCTGDDCPIYPAFQLCDNGSLTWNCDD